MAGILEMRLESFVDLIFIISPSFRGNLEPILDDLVEEFKGGNYETGSFQAFGKKFKTFKGSSIRESIFVLGLRGPSTEAISPDSDLLTYAQLSSFETFRWILRIWVAPKFARPATGQKKLTASCLPS